MTPPFQTPGCSESRRGASLIELLLALSILVVGLLAVFSTLTAATRHQIRAGARAEMTLLAEAKFDQLRSAAVSRTADTVQLAVGGSMTASVANYSDLTAMPQGRNYSRRWQVVLGPGGSRQVTLRIAPVVADIRVPVQIDFTTIVVRP